MWRRFSQEGSAAVLNRSMGSNNFTKGGAEPHGICFIKGSVNESRQLFRASGRVEIVDELVRPVRHAFAELLEFSQQQIAPAPCKQGREEANDFLVCRVVETVWYGDGIGIDENRTLEPIYDAIKVGFK